MPDSSHKVGYQLAQTANTIVYYALPDIVRSNALRKLLRTGIIGAMAYNEFQFWPLEPTMKISADDPQDDFNGADYEEFANNLDEEVNFTQGPALKLVKRMSENPALAAALTTMAGAGAIATIISAERAILRRGERKRAAGDRFAHLKQGLVLGALTHIVVRIIDTFDANHED
ncbi:hypothetical protein J2S70_001143 [Trueperella bonasi]|uniref:Uncharacterized protein n=1 Tax=Trueperella bonasi TaxID=312286 RepID=A0ABT9NGP1_9ACTO|nr:hypothetical protein [Trueperella bonasi]MDP9806561.1 hypothetical protein [Trueperella bonasi]